MTIDELKQFMTVTTERLLEIAEIKGHDYCTKEHTLVRAYEMAQVCYNLHIDTRTAAGVYAFELIDKVRRIMNLIEQDVDPECESFAQNADDLINYAFLLAAIIQDSRPTMQVIDPCEK